MSNHPEYTIVGQGICGTFLSYYLYKAGKSFVVYDESCYNTASKVASGVINPVTGRRIVRTWMIEEVMPFAVDVYTQLGKDLNALLIKQSNVIDFHPSPQMREAFEEREKQEEYLQHIDDTSAWKEHFNFYFGAGEISPCWLIDLNTLLSKWRKKLQDENLLIAEKYDIENIKNINTEQKIIFCDGVSGFDNPYFELLPHAKNKGEALIVAITNLPHNNIYKQGLSIVPWKDDLFWVGSSYEWSFEDANPTQKFRDKTVAQLKLWLKQSFEIVDHLAAVRPATLERRPFVGMHPLHNNIGILNGMGTKGCSLVPYFAHEFVEHLVNDKPINPLADVKRFEKVLGRKLGIKN